MTSIVNLKTAYDSAKPACSFGVWVADKLRDEITAADQLRLQRTTTLKQTMRVLKRLGVAYE